jgi:UDP-N-acetylmuramoyl-tripeptide--D-alanyl-D-alanine ligase
MESMDIREIIAATGGRVFPTTDEPDLDHLRIEGISTDSRCVNRGEAFFALRGERFDGHEFVTQALENKAALAVVSRQWTADLVPGERFPAPLIVVADPLRALQDLAGYYRGKMSVTVIGITGTNGKTTTKDMVAAVLSTEFPTMKTEGNFNNHIGVPLTLFRLSAKDQMAVVEMGMSGPGEIYRSAEISLPLYGLITNIGPAHLQQLSSLPEITKAKFELLEMLLPGGLVFLNADDERLMAQRVIPSSRVVTFGMGEGADYRATVFHLLDGLRTSFQVDGVGEFQIPTWGRHNVYNALAAIAVGLKLGLSVDQIGEALRSFSPGPMRMELVRIGGAVILNDAYNANPASMRAAIEVLAGLETDARKIAVLGDMLELGHQESQAHRELGCWVARSGIERLITVGELAEGIAQGAIQDGYEAGKVIRCADPGQAAECLKKMLKKGDLVLLKASRAVRLEGIIPALSSSLQKG